MPVSKEAVRRLLEPLKAVRPITTRAMFGGVGVYCEGVFFAVIDDDRLYLRADAENAPAFDAVGAAQWVVAGPSGGPMPYRELPQGLAGLELGAWIDAAVEAARRKRPKS
jgi:DNA transformation protein